METCGQEALAGPETSEINAKQTEGFALGRPTRSVILYFIGLPLLDRAGLLTGEILMLMPD